MKKIKFHFFENTSIVSLLIKIRLGSIFSHCGMEFDDGTFYHSTMIGGVQTATLEGMHIGHTVELEVSEEEHEACLAYAKSKLGISYDWKSLIGFFVGKKWQEDNGLFCSEYGRGGFEALSGVRLDYYNLVTPGQLRLLVDTYRVTKSA